jgi:hypothetical protein
MLIILCGISNILHRPLTVFRIESYIFNSFQLEMIPVEFYEPHRVDRMHRKLNNKATNGTVCKCHHY